MGKLKHIAVISGIMCLVLFISCQRKNKAASKTEPPPKQETVKKDTLKPEEPRTEGYYLSRKYKKATVTDMRELDGCQFMLELDSAHRLEPINLDEKFKINKLPVWIRYLEIHDQASICMAGQMVKVLEIEERKK